MESSMFPEQEITRNEKSNKSRATVTSFKKGEVANPKGRPNAYETSIKKRTEIEAIGRLMQLSVLYNVKSVSVGDLVITFHDTSVNVLKDNIEPPQHPDSIYQQEAEESKIKPDTLSQKEMKSFDLKTEMMEEFDEFQKLIDDPLGYEETQIKDVE
jgi:hypothetical protein